MKILGLTLKRLSGGGGRACPKKQHNQMERLYLKNFPRIIRRKFFIAEKKN